jgi:thiosulfate/3-mercaptopyruvate sulfurtransferase
MAIRTGEVLVGTEEVAAQLGDPNRRLLEVDEDTEAYGRGHIPGALAVHWRHDLQDPVRREFIGPQAFAALMDRLGIGNHTPVVLYGGNNNWFAAYAYWYFRYYGHQAVTLMDGGRKKWELEQRPLTQRVPALTATSGYQVAGPVQEIRALRDQVERGLGRGGRGLVDVRSPEEYRGELLAPRTCRRSRRSGPGTSPARPTSPGSRRSTRRPARSCRPSGCAACTRARG